jgi:hypothetical protein
MPIAITAAIGIDHPMLNSRGNRPSLMARKVTRNNPPAVPSRSLRAALAGLSMNTVEMEQPEEVSGSIGLVHQLVNLVR